jgi:hypothetical protein
MLQRKVSWRHWLAAGLLIVLLLLAGWRKLTRPTLPTAVAPPGPNVRMHDAPEGPISARSGRKSR